MNEARLKRVLWEMEARNLPQMLVSDPAAIFYLTGKWIHPGERMLALYINVNGNNKLFINELFPVYEDLGVEKVWFNDTQDSVEILSRYVDKEKPMGIDKNWPARFLLRLMELKGGSTFVNGSVILDRVRMCKDENEKDLMREASRINDLAVDRMIKLIPQMYTEKKMALELQSIYEELGAEGFSFDPIIAYGANAADPHHEPDNSTVKEGDSIIIDIGCKKNSYCSDMTRTVFYKKVSSKSKEVYNVVLEANKRAIELVKPGVRFCDIDNAAREYIEKAGYGKYFTHRTGHSIGIEVHDFGDVSSINTDRVEPGMIFSIEPGIYLTGEVGVRIEDLILVTEDGCEVLNKYDKELIIVE
ncbi:proline dipeptidase [Fervidicella metallireducens AeB]|uniref:Proline dipeptidase n=1 Tax=Fervidicella metallireducens AeB TaxID=1403537 RepID=A0A017RWU9_9CLOT|nr:Xaa-Pro peptidase family protein [Fervidicella metallireducens]EYE89258.1 proline dipeptidase [Fervidicella metallireducens AeB]